MDIIPIVEGEILPRDSLIDEGAFEHECWRLWEEAVQEVGFDPTQVSDLVWEIVGDPWSNIRHIPRYGSNEKKPTKSVIPALMPPEKRRSISE